MFAGVRDNILGNGPCGRDIRSRGSGHRDRASTALPGMVCPPTNEGLNMLIDHIETPELAPAAYLDEEAAAVATDAPEERAWLPSYQASLSA
ncbi:hypothetical protein DUI70_5284 [Streptomyces albus]|nr:hypothetical protein DUI70_5284 [Streptomyces albus]